MTPAAKEQAKQLLATVEEIDVARLYISKLESRKTVDADALKELAASIAQRGVQEALIVRATGGAAGPFEIVAGQRRFLASKIAGKPTCPCIVRNFTDAEAAELRVISNLQRENLPPIEEAEAFEELLAVPGATVESVAEKLGKAAGYVGRRLKILDAIEPVRDALKVGAIEVGHALELARLDEKQQMRLLSWMNCGYEMSDRDARQFDEEDELDDEFDDGDGNSDDAEPEGRAEAESEWSSTNRTVSELRRQIGLTTLKLLSDAPFPLDDELPPMACTECPKRSGNAGLLFEDCAQDTCTDRACFDTKVKVWVKAELEAADKAKRKLVMLANGWTGNKLAVSQHDVRVLRGEDSCEGQEDAIWIDGEKMGRRALICRDSNCKKHRNRGSMSSAKPEDPEKRKAERKQLLARVKAEKTYRAVLFKTIAAAPAPALAKAFDRIVTELANYALRRSDSTKHAALAEATGMAKESLDGWESKKSFSELAKRSAHARALIGWLAIHDGELTVHEHDVAGGGALTKARSLDLEDIADAVGVDWKKLRGVHAPEPEKKTAKKPKPKKPAAKKKAAKPRTPVRPAPAPRKAAKR